MLQGRVMFYRLILGSEVTHVVPTLANMLRRIAFLTEHINNYIV